MKLSGSPPEEVIYAWEDVKAMFNGGTRKRAIPVTSHADSLVPTKKHNRALVRPSTLLPCQKPSSKSELSSTAIQKKSLDSEFKVSLPSSQFVDYVWRQQQQISISATKTPNLCVLSCLPWVTNKKNLFFSSKVYVFINKKLKKITTEIITNSILQPVCLLTLFHRARE